MIVSYYVQPHILKNSVIANRFYHTVNLHGSTELSLKITVTHHVVSSPLNPESIQSTSFSDLLRSQYQYHNISLRISQTKLLEVSKKFRDTGIL